ncbi:MAG: hypothetical protein WAU59_09335 [Rhodoplanes sp.]
MLGIDASERGFPASLDTLLRPAVLNRVETWEVAVQKSAKKLGLAVGFCLAIAAGLNASAASARNTRVSVANVNAHAPATASEGEAQRTAANTGQKYRLPYYIDFRARTAASYGHAFIWYGRTGDRAVEVAGLHPATDSVIPYIIGHVVPVPAETGPSYGDLDEEYLQASYRIYLTEAQARVVFAYIKDKEAHSPLWHAATYNCVMFISNVANFIGLKTPGSHLLYPEDWVKQLAAMNGFRKTAPLAVSQ